MNWVLDGPGNGSRSVRRSPKTTNKSVAPRLVLQQKHNTDVRSLFLFFKQTFFFFFRSSGYCLNV